MMCGKMRLEFGEQYVLAARLDRASATLPACGVGDSLIPGFTRVIAATMDAKSFEWKWLIA